MYKILIYCSLFPVAFYLAAVLCKFNRTLQQLSRKKSNQWIGLLQCRLQPGTGMIPAKYHLVTAVYHLVWRLEESFANIWM